MGLLYMPPCCLDETECGEEMEGSRTLTQPSGLLRKIRGITRTIVEDICKGKSPLIFIDRFRSYCSNADANCCCSSDLPIGKDVVTLKRENDIHRLGGLIVRIKHIDKCFDPQSRLGGQPYIMTYSASVHFYSRYLATGAIYCSEAPAGKPARVKKRHILHVSICICSCNYSGYSVSVNMAKFCELAFDFSILVKVKKQKFWFSIKCSRHNLNVVSVGTGLVMGWLRFKESERKVDCIYSLNTAHPVPVHVEEVNGIQNIQREEIKCHVISVAQYILVVEKESVFQRLANDQFCSTSRCIVITGRGYPDIPTRRFLRLLIEKLRLPIYCLVDCDPYGFDILTTYRFGSMQMAYDAKFLRIPEVQWLGAFPSDLEKYNLPQQCLLPLTAEDKRRTEAMLLRCYLQRDVPQWRLELELMLQRGVKFEVEALSVHSLSFLAVEYIPHKIHKEMYV